MEYADQQRVQLFIDGIGEIDAYYDAATNEFVDDAGSRFGTPEEWADDKMTGMNCILLPDPLDK